MLLPTIDLTATGDNIKRLRKERKISVKDLQDYLDLGAQSIYKWQWGVCLPSVDNLFALSFLFCVSMNQILVSVPKEEKESTREDTKETSAKEKYFGSYQRNDTYRTGVILRESEDTYGNGGAVSNPQRYERKALFYYAVQIRGKRCMIQKN